MQQDLKANQDVNELTKEARRVLGEIARLTQPRKGRFKGRGIVTCAGGYRYFTNAWVLVKMLRHSGCNLPIQLWHFGPEEIDAKMRSILGRLEVECVDGTPSLAKPPGRGWALKAAAIARSSYREVLFLDADNLAVRDPSFLFSLPQYRNAGILFWPNLRMTAEDSPLLGVFGLPYMKEPEVETGQMLINKDLCWEALAFTEQLHLHSEVFSTLAPSGNDLYRLAWRKVGKSFAMPQSPPQVLTVPDVRGEPIDAVVCQHDFSGKRLFQHRMFCKWDLLGENAWVPGFFFESKCRSFLDELKHSWNGRIGTKRQASNSPKAISCKNSLIANTWILEIPAVAMGSPGGAQTDEKDKWLDQLPDFVKAPPNVGRVHFKSIDPRHPKPETPITYKPVRRGVCLVKELQFAANGTIKKGANAFTGYFWNLSEASKEARLLLSSESGDVISLRRVTRNFWEGTLLNGPAADKIAKLGVIDNLYFRPGSPSNLESAKIVRKELIRSHGKCIHVACSADDIGDHILACYTCAGLSQLGFKVVFHSQHAPWLARVKEPGLKISQKGHDKCFDLNYFPPSQIRYALSKVSTCAAGLHPLLQPKKPEVSRNKVKRRFPFDNYIVLAPGLKRRDCNWPEAHWTRLANLLRAQQHEIVAIGSASQAGTLLRIFSQTQAYWTVGHPPEWIIDTMLGAAAYIGVDCDMTHLAALLGIKTVAIHSQFPASFLWPYSKVESASPKTACAYCRLQEDRGYLASCDSACSALATVGPETVMNTVLKLLCKP